MGIGVSEAEWTLSGPVGDARRSCLRKSEFAGAVSALFVKAVFRLRHTPLYVAVDVL